MKNIDYSIIDTKVSSSLDSIKHSASIYRAVLLYGIVSLFLFFEMAVQVSPSVMASQLMNDLNTSSLGLGMVSGLYFYSYTAMQIPSGLLLDKYSHRLIITVAVLICSLGSLFFGLAGNIYLAALARLLMGCGSAFAFVSVLVVTADLFHSKYFPMLAGITQMLAALGAMSGQMPIEILVLKYGWRSTMIALSMMGIILAGIIWNFLKHKNNYNNNNADVRHLDIKNNLKKVLSIAQTWYVALYACLLWAPMSGFASLWGVPYLINNYHLGQTTSALLCSTMWLGLAIGSPLFGLIMMGSRNKIIILSVSALMGAVSFYLILQFHFSIPVLGALLFLAGASCSGQAISFALIKENNPASIKGTALAFNNMAVVVSGAIFQPLIGKLIESDEASFVTHYNESNFKFGLSLILLAYLIAFFIAVFFLKESKKYPLNNAI